MIARVAAWEPMPTDDRDWVLEVVTSVPGVHGAYHLVDPTSGNGLSITFFEDEAAAQAAHRAIEERGAAMGWNRSLHPAPTSQTFYDVVRHA